MVILNTADYLLLSGADQAVALIDGDREYAYRDLRAAVATVAAHLRSLRLPPGSPVALVAGNGLFWIAGYLGTMRAGLVSVPISTTLTPAEVAARVDWLGAQVVLIDRASERRLAGVLDSQPHRIGEAVLVELQEDPDHDDRIDPQCDAAYLFTSGTTGEPRAVRITHRNIQANTESILAYLQLHPSDRALLSLPLTYVFGASVLHTHLRAGATIVNHRSSAYPETIVEALDQQRCTVFAGVPSTFHILMRNSSFRERALPHLRLIQQAGGRMSPAVLRELIDCKPDADVFVMYGQTEATARLSYLPPAQLTERPTSIGRGMQGVQLRVLGEDGRDVAPGEVGEIVARGENVSPGYVADLAASERKMPDGVLFTGDLATVDDEGFIYVVDRAADFIKSWGNRIASQDIESVVMELPELVAAAAVGIPDPAAGERVELAVVLREGAPADSAPILAHCRAVLPRHMIPEAVHFLGELPQNANGKVVKRVLRDRLVAQADTADST